MESHLYEKQLAGHKIFKDLEDSLIENSSGKLRNLLELKDDVLYVWNPKENCLWCLNLKQLEEHGDETPYQKLLFLSPPSFSVERVMASPCGSRICVWGARGVTIAELPLRWGRGGLFDAVNNTVLCKSQSLDERFLYAPSEVRRVHWHPSSLSHVMVLVSDNTIRLYNIALKSGPKLVKLFTTGPKPCSLISGRTLLESLGDTAVDFTPLPESNTLLILRGNGDVYMLTCDLDGKNPLGSGVVGPLAMFPPADDNYGSESCCVSALGARDAPLLVLATASAALYHCLLLPRTSDSEEGDSHALYVVESVELNTTDDVLHSYPVNIIPCSRSSYAVVHAGGVHTVTLPIISQLMEYAMADEVETEVVSSSVCMSLSSARHVARLAPRPAAGLALSSPPLSRLLILCDHGLLLTRVLEPFDLEEQLYKEMQLKNPALLQDDINAILKEKQRVSFTAIIQEILTRESSQPILNISRRDEPPPQECLELLSSACVRYRGEYMWRQARCAAAILDKLRAHQALTHTHAACLQHLHNDAKELEEKSITLRKKCILAEKRQDDLKYRCSVVMRSWGGSGASVAERELLARLHDSRRRVTALAARLHDTRVHAAHRPAHLKQWKEDYKRKDVALGKSHSDTIAAVLQQQTVQISSIIEETKLLKDQLSIV